MNKITEVTRILGLNPYEEFKIESYPTSKFRFTDSELQVINHGKWVEANTVILGYLIYGREITRLPYLPKHGDSYWTLTGQDFGTTHTTWQDCTIDYCRLKLGMVFRTKEELVVKRDEIYQMLTGNGLEV